MNRVASPGLTFLAGLAVGALVCGVLLQGIDAPSSTVEAMAAETRTEEAKASLLPLPEPASAKAASQSQFDSNSSRVALSPTDASASEILAELNRAHARGEIPDEVLLQVLLNAHLQYRRAEAALELVMRYRPQDATALVAVAVSLAQYGRQELAQKLIDQAMALGPENEWILDQYASVDAAGALPHYLRKLAQQPPPGDFELRMVIASLYAKCARLDDARAQIDGLLRQNPQDGNALRLLAEIDPASAERVLCDLIANGDPDRNWQGFLFQIVVDQGRVEDALAMLERDRASGIEPDSGAYGAIAQKYLEQEQLDSAIQMWSRAFDAETGDPDNWTAALQEHAPAKLLTMLEARVAAGANDEFWGALGDSYWRANRRAEALNCWREAVRMDPEDGEWPTKVAAVLAGSDPL